LILWNVYKFFIDYATLAGWPERGEAGLRSASAPGSATPMDRWILSRAAGLAAAAEDRLANFDTLGATRHIEQYIDDLSTWYLRLSRRRFSRRAEAADRTAAFDTLHAALVAVATVAAPILPFLSEALWANLRAASAADAPDSVHLLRWPTASLAAHRDTGLETAMATARRAVDLARTLRGTAGLKTRQPLARMWLAVPGGGFPERDFLLGLIADEVNVRDVQLIDDESALVERRVKPLLPKIGRRLGAQIPAVMAAARAGEFELQPDGSVTLGGVTLAPDEVEIQATPRPGTAVAHDQGLVVVIDTELTPELRAEGDARELQRAVQDLRRTAGLALDDRIELWVDGLGEAVAALLPAVARETLAERALAGAPSEAADGNGLMRGQVELAGGPATIAIRRIETAKPG
jgi:isoleucyl-tRNA synthetase